MNSTSGRAAKRKSGLNSDAAPKVVIALGALALIALIWWLISASGSPATNSAVFIDARTGKSFGHTMKEGEMLPIEAPSGGKTGYPAEFCWWNKDGSQRAEPYPVLLNHYKGQKGPTFCDDCGRLVIPQATAPRPGDKAPPTREEYSKAPPRY